METVCKEIKADMKNIEADCKKIDCWVGVRIRELKLASRARKHKSAGHFEASRSNVGCLQKVHSGCKRPTRSGNRSRLLAVVVKF